MFHDRAEAGLELSRRLRAVYTHESPLVLALPRGGLPVAAPVARDLHADLDVLVVRKLGVPGNPEFAMGAVGEDGVRVVDGQLCRQLGISDAQLEAVAAAESAEVTRRVQRYRGAHSRLQVLGRNVIVVDDGLATGSTAAASVAVLRHLGAQHVSVAVPVGSVQAVDWLRGVADDVICLSTPDPFYAVGEHYEQFDQVSDEEVIGILQEQPHRPVNASAPRIDDDITIDVGDVQLAGHVFVPASARGLVVFAHGSGSSRMSPRNVAVATRLNGAGLGTLLFDLLTPQEADVRNNVFDIELLADRLSAVADWVRDQPYAADLPLGYFGASTGAAAALVADAKKPGIAAAIVSRGGRPDLAGGWLGHVQAPTLLIVGGHDNDVLELNRQAQRRLDCPNLLEVVRGATHLFEEPGALCQVSRLAQSWFQQHMT